MIDFDHQTLDEIKAHDIDNLSHLLNNRNRRVFHDVNEYKKFRSQFFITHLSKMGGDELLKDFYEGKIKFDNKDIKQINYLKEKYGIDLDVRDRQGEDSWRSGFYLYKHNEIVAFISKPQRIETRLTLLTEPGYEVYTASAV